MSFSLLLLPASVVVSAVTLAMLLLLEWRSAVHWLCAAGLVLLSAECLLAFLAFSATTAERLACWENQSLWIASFLPGVWLLFSLTFAREDAHKHLGLWRWPVALLWLFPLGVEGFCHTGMVASVAQTAWGRSWLIGLTAPAVWGNLFMLLGSLTIVMQLQGTYRAAVGLTRWKIRYLVLGLSVIFIVRVFTSSQVVLFGALHSSLQVLNSTALLAGCLLIQRSLLRAESGSVSVRLSPLLEHRASILLLGGTYLLSLELFADQLDSGAGEAEVRCPPLLISSALALATVWLCSDRARLGLNRLVRRFVPWLRHDYLALWRSFTVQLTTCVEPSEVCQALTCFASKSFQASSVSLWLVDEQRERLSLADSTFLGEAQAEQLHLEPDETAQVLKVLDAWPGMIDLDASREHWARALRRCHPQKYSKGGNRLCVPLLAGGELLGILIVGDRVDTAALSIEEPDLLNSVCSQTAETLLRIRLGRKLAEARQGECLAFLAGHFKLASHASGPWPLGHQIDGFPEFHR